MSEAEMLATQSAEDLVEGDQVAFVDKGKIRFRTVKQVRPDEESRVAIEFEGAFFATVVKRSTQLMVVWWPGIGEPQERAQ